MIDFDGAMAGGMLPFPMAPNAGSGNPQPVSGSSLAAVDRVRNVFPETWLWTNSTSGYLLQSTDFPKRRLITRNTHIMLARVEFKTSI